MDAKEAKQLADSYTSRCISEQIDKTIQDTMKDIKDQAMHGLYSTTLKLSDRYRAEREVVYMSQEKLEAIKALAMNDDDCNEIPPKRDRILIELFRTLLSAGYKIASRNPSGTSSDLFISWGD
ncbi:hypothetical protein KC887_03015 [Candidatus Kaiserbacteria bacterium]|nr:hypothetical protein [Candidatus Kaiserbacteria bacterium]